MGHFGGGRSPIKTEKVANCQVSTERGEDWDDTVKEMTICYITAFRRFDGRNIIHLHPSVWPMDKFGWSFKRFEYVMFTAFHGTAAHFLRLFCTGHIVRNLLIL